LALTPGTRIGVYEVTAQIGEGGMGAVYRATDTSLGRQVAIKVLPDAFAQDAERLARFEREAKTLAALNHPNIAAIYGLERSSGTQALVMELVEGDDLSQRIAKGAIPLDEALAMAKQIAEALEAAHEQGIIHRDLKPANIKVRSDGTVKVLDFGLAKAMEPAAGSSSSISMSPTITTPAMMTGVGMILGTAAYMSPEQAKGRVADKRSDVWAFGCVLYEMLTGQRAFAGDDVGEVLAEVIKVNVDWRRRSRDAGAALPAKGASTATGRRRRDSAGDR
jgi:serine/threonine protein kinase